MQDGCSTFDTVVGLSSSSFQYGDLVFCREHGLFEAIADGMPCFHIEHKSIARLAFHTCELRCKHSTMFV